MFRSPWFWIAVVLIAAGILLTATLGVVYWLLGVLAVGLLAIVITFVVAAYAVGETDPALTQVPLLEKAPYSKRIPVVYDCDVAMGRLFRDVSDGLAMLYLLGEPQVHLLGVTTTYGNHPARAARRVARRLADAVEHQDLPVIAGAGSPEKPPEENQAARFLVEAAAKRPGEIALVASGSLTNLKHAAALDPDFFDKLRGVYVFGGVTEPLMWNEHQLAEFNFSADPEAAYQVIRAPCPVTLVTGQAGLTAVFRSPQFAALQALDSPVARLISRRIRSWFAVTRLYFQDGGFGMWASLAAMTPIHPQLLEVERVYVTSTRVDLRTGYLAVNRDGTGPVQLVNGVKDFEGFIMAHLAAWKHLEELMEIKEGS